MEIFAFRKIEQAKLSNVGIWTTKWTVRETTQLFFSHFFAAPCLKMRQWKRECDGKDMQKNASIFFLFPRLRDYPPRKIFENDSAASHYANEVRQYSDTKHPGWWMGKVGPISWPSRSPNLTLYDYFLWEKLEYIVYCDSVNAIAK